MIAVVCVGDDVKLRFDLFAGFVIEDCRCFLSWFVFYMERIEVEVEIQGFCSTEC
jgi:hypothetical protein